MSKRIVFVILMVAFFVGKTYAADPEVKIGLNIGDKAPEISEAGLDGKTINLSDLKGKVVLIDFWAAWCGPCRRENPAVVAAYQKYKDSKFTIGKGFTIYSVSLDQTKAAWEAAIAKDQLEWPYHVSDLKGWNAKYATIYQVQTIPANFLIDGKGIIIAKNLRGVQIEQALGQLSK